MIRIKLSPSKIITFDGETLELFDDYLEDSKRVHIAHIKKIAVEPDHNGNPSLSLSTDGLIVRLPFDQTQMDKVTALAGAVHQAMTDLAW
jgi:hypothetical protein